MDRRNFLKTALTAGGASVLLNPSMSFVRASDRIKDINPGYWKLAPVPPMGWNSYDTYGSGVTESEYLANAEVMQHKLLPYGYHYAVIDYLWFDPKLAPANIKEGKPTVTDKYGRCIPAPNKFPSAAGDRGFKPVSDKIHAMGLKFGIHIMRGIPRVAVEQNTPVEGSSYHARDAADTSSTCSWDKHMYGVKGGTEAGQAYYDSLARLYAQWGVQFIKVDDLSRPFHTDEIHAIRKALDKYAPDIVFSTSPGETPVNEGTDIEHHANMWRMTNDFWDNWKSLDHTIDVLHSWQGYGGPGHWPDCDMLCLGHIGLRSVDGPRFTRFTMDEQRTVMSMWALAPSPLMLGNNLTELDPWTLDLITNPEVISVNQDTAGKQGIRISKDGPLEVWSKDLNDGSKAVGLLNRGEHNGAAVSVDWNDLNIKGKQTVRDVWQHTDLGAFTRKFQAMVAGHGIELVRIKPV